VTVATCGGDRLLEKHAPADKPVRPENSLSPPELLALLDQSQDALATARGQLADSERRAADAQRLAARLQEAIMPAGLGLAARAGIELAARWRPARPGFPVAGDWYDALPLPGGDLLLVVGDIAGHGIEAVAGMVAARNALRGLAVTGAEPRELVARLNHAACLFAEDVTGTVIVARYTPAGGRLRWARAGHLPPVLVRDGVGMVQPMPEGMLLGVYPEDTFEQAEFELLDGDTLLLCTDGLIERRTEPISDALAAFAAAAAPVGGDLDSHVKRLLDGSAADTGDDACLLALRVGRERPPGPAASGSRERG
jgi:serine phosphatase RsbU (regulator of sigma subunit)